MVNRSRVGEVFFRKAPIEQFVDYSFRVVGAAILIIEVISVLPYVDRQQGCLAFDEGYFGVAGFDDLELPPLGDQPTPSRPELGHARVDEFFLEIIITAEIGFQLLGNDAARLATAAALQAIPEKRVIPRLR